MMEKNVPFLSELAQIRHSYLVFDLNFATQKQGEDQRALLSIFFLAAIIELVNRKKWQLCISREEE